MEPKEGESFLHCCRSYMDSEPHGAENHEFLASFGVESEAHIVTYL